ncbi:MAG: glutaredoxin domain-containing protein [Bacteroidales bacterium]|jgi:glutaredoxin-like YruB-family protein|nr:glutaredoxin domain-containing protein [Bacteroidales bacterium]
MAIHTIQNHEEMLAALLPDKKNYVLLYKAGNESSECGLSNLKKAAEKLTKLNILLADVSVVRDIHENYQIKSAPSLLVFDGKNYVNVVKGCNDPAYYISLFEETLFNVTTKEGEAPQKRVTVYSTPTCSWCNTLKTYLKAHDIRFTDIDVSKNQSAAEQMVRRSGQQGVPQTDINGEIIIGFDKPKINRLLGIQLNN